MYWDSVQLVLAGRSDELPTSTTPHSTNESPGYVADIVQFDDEGRFLTDLQVLAITPKLLMDLTSLDIIVSNTFTPESGPVLEDALTWSHVYCRIPPQALDRVLQLDYVMRVDFSWPGVVRGISGNLPSDSIMGSSLVLPENPVAGQSVASSESFRDPIDVRVIAAFAGDPSVRTPKAINSLPGMATPPPIAQMKTMDSYRPMVPFSFSLTMSLETSN
jgi:hypothetical protein